MRVAALADVHGNAPALAAVLEEVGRERPDVVVFCGDLTWGSLVQETLALVRAMEIPARFVRGNADRAVLELAAGGVDEPTPRERWMVQQHGADDLALLGAFEDTVVLEVDGLGRACFAHGSPRSDEECVTVRTPESRVRELSSGVDAACIVTGHTHMQYERRVAGLRLVNPGSVGLPYEAERGAYRALLGPDVELRRTAYDVDAAIAGMRATGDPRVDDIVALMVDPPTQDAVIEDAERRVFAG